MCRSEFCPNKGEPKAEFRKHLWDRVQPWKPGRAREMRRNPTRTEGVLWEALQRKQLGVQFVRQKVILGYIVDFMCRSRRLVVEVDGGSHAGRSDWDARRDGVLAAHGIRTLRVPADEVLSNLPAVVGRIRAALNEKGVVSDSPPW